MSSGGRFNRGGNDNRKGRNNHHTGRGGRGGGGDSSGYNQKREETRSKNEIPMLTGKPSAAESHRWLNSLELWARTEIPNGGWHLILKKEGGPAPVVQPNPVEPDIKDFVDQPQVFAAKHAIYRTEEARVYKKNEDITREQGILYGKMMTHISEDLIINLKAKYGKDFLEDENPKKLADAINSELLTLDAGKSSKREALAMQERRFSNIKQKSGQSLAGYREYYDMSFRSMCITAHHLQLSSSHPKSLDEIIAEFSDTRHVNTFITGLDEHIYKPYREALNIDKNEKWPKNLDAAYERVSQLEHIYVSRYNASRNNRDDRQRFPVMAAGAKTNKQQKAKPKDEFDSHGQKICYYEKNNGAGSCKFGAKCTYSHEIDHGGKTKGGTVASGGGPSADASQCGGGPAPKKG